MVAGAAALWCCLLDIAILVHNYTNLDAEDTGTSQTFLGASGEGVIRKDEGFFSSADNNRSQVIRPALLPLRTNEDDMKTSLELKGPAGGLESGSTCSLTSVGMGIDRVLSEFLLSRLARHIALLSSLLLFAEDRTVLSECMLTSKLLSVYPNPLMTSLPFRDRSDSCPYRM